MTGRAGQAPRTGASPVDSLGKRRTDEGAAAHQRSRPPVLGAGAAARRRHRQPRPRPSYQPRRRQHRRDPAPADGRRARSSARPRRHRRGRARSCAERVAASRAEPAFTEDRLLGGRVRLRQPAQRRTASRSTRSFSPPRCRPSRTSWCSMSAAAAAPRRCASPRGCRIAASSGSNCSATWRGWPATTSASTAWQARVTVIAGDLLQPPPRAQPRHVRPCHGQPALHRARPRPARRRTRQRRRRRSRASADLADWVRFALAMVRAEGQLTFIHRADRIDALLGQLAGRAGEVVVFPLWPAAGRAASRVLVRARKQVAAPARLLPGLVLHEADGRFTAAARGGPARRRGARAVTAGLGHPLSRRVWSHGAVRAIPICGCA